MAKIVTGCLRFGLYGMLIMNQDLHPFWMQIPKSGPLRSPHPKTSLTPRITPQEAKPSPAWAYLISEVHPKNWPEFSKTMESGLTTSPSTPCTPSWSTPKTRHLITKCVVSSMKSSVQNALPSMSVKLPAHWRQGYRPPKTEVPMNSCGRTWTSHQNGQCQSDSPWGQYVATQDLWVHRNQDPPPGHQPWPRIWAPPHLSSED